MLRLLILSCALILLPPLPAQAATPLPSTSVTRYGLHLSLTLPGTTFPRNALVRVSVSLHNGSGKPYTTDPGTCPGSTITAQVVNNLNVAIYPPVLPPLTPISSCRAKRVTIAPGKTITRNLLVILRDNRVRAVAQLTAGKRVAALVTPALTLHLTSRTAPTLAASGQAITVTPPPGATGKLDYTQYLQCTGTSTVSIDTLTTSSWTQTSGTDISLPPTCSGIEEWDVVAGYQGYPVAHAHICAPDAACPYIHATAGLVNATQNDAVRLTLTLPHKSYPQNALVQATVSLQNVSAHPVWFTNSCPLGVLSLRVTDGQGGQYFPPALPNAPKAHCKKTQPAPLAPGDSITRAIFAVLRAPYIQALAEVGKTPGTYFETPPLPVQLTPSTPPVVSLFTSPLEAFLTPPSTHPGPLYVNSWTSCTTPTGTALSLMAPDTFKPIYGTDAIGPQVSGPCTSLEWHAIAGWIGYPAVVIHYP